MRQLSHVRALVLGAAFTGTLTLSACGPATLPAEPLVADGRDRVADASVDRSDGSASKAHSDPTATARPTVEPSVPPTPTPTPTPATQDTGSEEPDVLTDGDDQTKHEAPTVAGSKKPSAKPRSAPTPKREPGRSEPTRSSARGAPSGVADAGLSAPSALESRDIRTFAEDGAVLENVLIDGDLTVNGMNQTLRNVRVTGKLQLRSHGTLVESSELGTLSVSASTDVVIRSVEISGKPGEDGIHVTSGRALVENLLIEGTRIHSPRVTGGSHYDGIQVRGVKGLTLRNNSFELGAWKKQYTAAVFLEDTNGGNRNVLIEDNYIDGGGYALYLFGRDIEVVDNTFGPSQRWGHVYPSSHMHAVTAIGNLDHSGRPVDL